MFGGSGANNYVRRTTTMIMYQLAELLERGKATVLHPDSRDCWLALESAEHILSEMLSLSAFSGYSLEDGECYTGSCSGA